MAQRSTADPVGASVGMFHRYRVTSIVAFVTLAGLGLLALFLQLRARVEAQRNALEFRLTQHAQALEGTLRSAVDHVGLLEASATFRLAELAAGHPRTDLSLVQESDGKHYRQAQPPHGTSPADRVWISGTGDPTNLPLGVQSELEVASTLGPLFRATSANVPQTTWVYYVSRHDFFALYPPGDTPVRFEREVYDTAGFREITPDQNPERRTVWTEAYVDFGKQGLMVTAAKPVYVGDDFLGQVGLDLTLDDFNRLGRDYAAEVGTTLLANERGQLLAHPSLVTSADAAVKPASEAFPEALRPHAAKLLAQPGRVQLGGYLILHQRVKSAPWSLVSLVPEHDIWLAQLPSLGVGFALLMVGLLALLVVAHRTRELNERNLRLEQALGDLNAAQQQLVAQEKMASLGSLAVSLAHEANTPLGAMRSATDTIDRIGRTIRKHAPEATNDPVLQKNVVALERLTVTLREATERVSGLVASLKGFEAVGEGAKGSCDPNALARRAIALASATAGERAPSFETDLTATRDVAAPAEEVFRMLTEIVKNACQAVEGAEGRILVRSADENELVVLQVEDNGRGIPAEQLPHLFDLSFERTGNRVRVGMGLKVAYAIVTRNGGSIEIESAPSAGTSVRIALPAAAAAS